MKRYIAQAITGAVIAGLLFGQTGCSLFVPHRQKVSIQTIPSGAAVEIDGKPVGTSPLSVDLRRDRQYVVLVKLRGKSGNIQLQNRISTAGVLDCIGAFLFAVPALGILAPGFRELETTSIVIPLN